MDFIEIVNRIFINKSSYKDVSDEDKVNSFFIINRKFGKQYPEIANQFNHKNIDKASAIDMWFEFFKNEYKIPYWYWDPKDRIKKTKENKKNNYNDIKIREDLKDNDIDYLEKYFEKEIKKEKSKLKSYMEDSI